MKLMPLPTAGGVVEDMIHTAHVENFIERFFAGEPADTLDPVTPDEVGSLVAKYKGKKTTVLYG